jgi:hypothetical protein
MLFDTSRHPKFIELSRRGHTDAWRNRAAARSCPINMLFSHLQHAFFLYGAPAAVQSSRNQKPQGDSMDMKKRDFLGLAAALAPRPALPQPPAPPKRRGVAPARAGVRLTSTSAASSA